MTRSRSLAVFVLGSLLMFVGCKQDVGERCERSSDCASGYCGGDNSDVGIVSAAGKTCTPGRVIVTPDAGTPPPDTGTGQTGDAAAERSDSGDALAAETGDVAPEAHAEVGEAGADTGAEAGTDGAHIEVGAETSAADGATDLVGDAPGVETAASGG
jgi:hypothetical protein